ncbi:MAG TPA: hypothetical protein VLD62_09065 [Acidimicrobiia bacterium]|nr:hypothetical protein [Acidimicrobiia bacterium]
MEELKSLEDLLELQGEDSAIDRLLERRQHLPELDDYKAAHARVAALEADRDALADRIRQAELGVDKAEGELEISEIKLTQEERRLYAGGLSARDAEHLRQEVEMLRRRISDREDEVISLMEEREQAEAEAEDVSGRLAPATEERNRLEGIISETWKEIDGEIARHEARKGEIAPIVPDDLMELYEELRDLKTDGVGAARLADGVCGGCHLRLSAAEQSQAMKESPPRCIHCRRILVR